MEYVDSLDIEKIHLKNTLNSCQPTLKNDFVIEVTVYNPSQENEILANKEDIYNFLCQKLNNSSIDLTVNISEKNDEEMIYTAEEKFNYLKKNNANLEKLVEAFNLVY